MGPGVPAHSWDQEQWESWLLALLDDTVREIDLDEWTVALAGSMTQQFGLYGGQGQVGEKCFLMRCLGQVSAVVLTVEPYISNLRPDLASDAV